MPKLEFLNIKSSSGFFKIIVLLLTSIVAGGTGSQIASKVIPSDNQTLVIHDYDKRFEALETVVNDHSASLASHSTDINNLKETNVEIKASLVDIQTDIKKLLFYAGENHKR